MRRAVTAGVERGEAGKRLRDGIGARQADMRSFLAETADRDVKQSRVERGERVVAKPEPRRDAGTEALDDDVGPLRQVERDLAARRRPQVERQSPLAAVEMRRHRGVVTVALAEPARPVATRRFELHDIRAVHRQQHRAIRRGDALPEIQNAQAGIGTFDGHRCPRCSPILNPGAAVADSARRG